MALIQQGYNIPFGQGLDKKSDPNQVMAGKFLGLQNINFGTTGLLKKRNGFGLYSSLPNALGTTLTTLQGNLLATGSTLQAYSQDTQQWISRGQITPVRLSVQATVRTSSNMVQADAVVIANGLSCTAATDNNGKAYYTVTDSATGQAVVPLTLLPTTSVSPKVFVFTNYFIVTYLTTIGGTHLQFIALPLANPSTPQVVTSNDISIQVGSLASGYDGAVYGNNIYFAWDSSDSGGGVRLATLNSNLNVSVSTLIAGKKASLLTAAVDSSGSTPVIWYTFFDAASNNGYSTAYNSNGTVLLAPTQVFTTPTVIAQLSSIVLNQTLTIAYETYNTYGFSSAVSDFISYKSISLAGTITHGSASTGTLILRGVGLASKVFNYVGVTYMLAVYAGVLQPTYFLIDLAGNVYSRLAGTNAYGYINTPSLPSVSINGTDISIGYLIKTQISAVNKTQGVANVNGIYAQAGVNIATFNINTAPQYSAEIAQSLHLTGGMLWQYDGVKPVEHSFQVYPEDLAATTGTGTGGSIAASQYYYAATYEWTDGQGILQRSAPSVPLGLTVSAGASTNTIIVPTLRQTYKVGTNPVRIVLYRWSTAQPNYYQITSINSPLLNDVTQDSVTYLDKTADAGILGNTLLYTTGGVIENGPAPASIASCIFGSRLFTLDAENRNQVHYSKQVLAGTPVEMSDFFTRYVPPSSGPNGSTVRLTTLAAMDDKLILFSATSLYYMTGIGPDNTGANSDFSNPIYITGSIGCSTPNSIVLTPMGLMFKTDKGIWMLGRDLSTKYIGADVESFNSSSVLSAVTVPATNEVRFALDSGVMLVYDYYQAQWGTFVGAPSISSTLYNSQHTLLNKFGQVLQETPGVYLDNTSPVLISLTTAWLKMTNLQGFQRAYCANLLASYITPHLLSFGVAYDYNPAVTQLTTIVPTNSYNVYGSNSPYGSGTYGGSSAVEQWQINFEQQKCEAVQLTITESYDASQGVPAGAGLTMSGLNLVFGAKKVFHVSRAQTVQVRLARPADLKSVQKWCTRRSMPIPQSLVANTLIVPGVVAANLRAVEGGYWLMDGLVTNPLCSSATRHSALVSLYATITKSYTNILAWSVDEGAITRAQQIGFEVVSTQTILRYTRPV